MLVKPICKFDFKIDIVKQNKTSFFKTDLEPLTPILLKRSKNNSFFFKNPSLIINKWKIGLSHVYVRNMKGSQIDLSFGSTETLNNTVSDKMVAH